MSIERTSDVARITGPADVLMVLLYAPANAKDAGAPIRGITRLQKLMFLLWKEGRFLEDVANLYDFHANDYGPRMDELYDIVEFFAAVDLLKVSEVPCGNEFEEAEESLVLKDFGFHLGPTGFRK